MKANISMEFTDLKEIWALELSNSVLNNTKGRVLKNPDVKLTLTRPAFLAMLLQGKKLPELVQAGMVKVEGNPKVLADGVRQRRDLRPVLQHRHALRRTPASTRPSTSVALRRISWESPYLPGGTHAHD